MEEINFNCKTPTWNAIRAIALNRITQVQESSNLLHNLKEPENLHQLRIELRKLCIVMQLLIKLFPGLTQNDLFMGLKQEVNKREKQLSLARDWDIFTNIILPHIPIKTPSMTEQLIIRQKANKLTLQTHQQIIEIINTNNYKVFWLELKSWFELNCLCIDNATKHRAIIKFSDAMLKKKRKQLLKYHKIPISSMSEQQLHKLRMFIKKYRYSLNFFAHLYSPKCVNKYLSILIKLQDILGTRHDLSVVNNLCGILLKQADNKIDEQYILVIGQIIGWKAREVDSLNASSMV